MENLVYRNFTTFLLVMEHMRGKLRKSVEDVFNFAAEVLLSGRVLTIERFSGAETVFLLTQRR